MAAERYTGLAAVLPAVRSEDGITQAVLADRVGLGRSVVAERVGELEAAGLLITGERAPSTGGRAPRRLTLNASAGFVVAADIASFEQVVVAADLSGEILYSRKIDWDVTDGPHAILERVHAEIEAAVAEQGDAGPLLGIGVGLPGPVNLSTGVPIGVPVLSGWDGYPVRDELASRWSVPVWVDNRVNLLALAEYTFNPLAANVKQLLYFSARRRERRVSHNRWTPLPWCPRPRRGHGPHRRSRGGNGGVPLRARSGAWKRSPVVGRLLATHSFSQRAGRARAWPKCSLRRAASVRTTSPWPLRVATSPLTICSTGPRRSWARASQPWSVSFAPQFLVIGGGIARAGAIALDPIRTTLYRQLPRALGDDLVVELSTIDEQLGGVLGAIQLTLGELLTKEHLPTLLGSVSGLDESSLPVLSA